MPAGFDWSTILLVVLMGAALYFMMIRPQQKRTKEQKEKMAALAPGARVMTISGIFGTVNHLGEKQAILEISPGVEITVDKRAISTQPVEDEFEYVDSDDADPEPANDPQPSETYEPLVVEDPKTFDPTRPDAQDPRQN